MKSLITYDTHLILSRIYFNDVKLIEIKGWAINAKANGINEELLSGLLKPKRMHKEEVIKLFLSTIKVLKIKSPKSLNELFKLYSIDISMRYLSEKIEPKLALNKILTVLKESNEKDKYLKFIDFCHQYKLLGEDLKVNVHKAKLNRFKDELDSIFLEYVETNYHLRLRTQLEQKSNKQLVYDRYYDFKKYIKMSLLIIDDILRQRGISQKHIDELKESIDEEE